MVIFYVLDYPVICSSGNVLRSFEEEGKGIYRWLNGVQIPGWCEAYTRGCPVRSGVIVAGSSEGLNRPRVELLDVPKIDQKQLPDLILPSALVAMAWDSADNSLVVVGGVKYEEPYALCRANSSKTLG